jgi:tRNA(fMet)-specific endonuclease VapC
VVEPRYLLDSNILIYLLEGISPATRARVESCEPGEVATSAIAYAEMMLKITSGDTKRLSAVEKLFTAIKLLPFDGPAALAYRDVPFRRGSFDRLIAAHALALGLVIVTNNEGDYADVPQLVIENWTLS